ncbi:MAG: hypothetical protein AAB267_04330, partial [Candidatus Desantisbacteria bacterium]
KRKTLFISSRQKVARIAQNVAIREIGGEEIQTVLRHHQFGLGRERLREETRKGPTQKGLF